MNLVESIKQLISETEDFNDAMEYIDDVALEVGCSRGEAITELRRQYEYGPESED